jgi:hypothetical protein
VKPATMVLSAAALLVTVLQSDGHAYLSMCVPGSSANDMVSLASTVCGVASNKLKKCPDGASRVRSPEAGEHSLLTQIALEMVGLGNPMYPSAGGDLTTVIPRYADGDTLAIPGKNFYSLEPAGPARMYIEPGVLDPNVVVQHRINEYAEMPDAGYSLADALLGNEHCLLPRATKATPVDVENCHSFSAHLGPVNSTHFPPQSRAVYRHYHGLAMATAKRCAAMRDALQGQSPSYLDQRSLPSCEFEALAIEAWASHFVADSWSSGHMWQRWGLPLLASSPLYRAGQVLTAAVSGLEHGWRASVANSVSADFQHDQLCMPGPFNSGEPVVSFTFPSAPDPTHPWAGAGDFYLLPCAGRTPEWSIFGGNPQLQNQKARMLSCMAHGFAEVYNSGPRLATGGPASIAGSTALPFSKADPSNIDDTIVADPVVASLSLNPKNMVQIQDYDPCWTQSANNQSMGLGWGISAWRSMGPEVAARVLVSWPAKAAAAAALGVSLADMDKLSNKARLDLVKIAKQVHWRAARAPYAIDVSSLTTVSPPPGSPRGPLLETLVWNPRNSESAGLITNGQVPYFEPADPATWDAILGAPCSSDADCEPNPLPGNYQSMYCDYGSVGAPGQGVRHCVRSETAVLRAFRLSEVPAWCHFDGQGDVMAAAQSVTDLGSSGMNAAYAQNACQEMIAPHVRTACDLPSYTAAMNAWKAAGVTPNYSPVGNIEPRSTCDLFLQYQPPSASPLIPSGITPLEIYAGIHGLSDLCTVPGLMHAATTAVAGSTTPYYDIDLSPPATPTSVTLTAINSHNYDDTNRYSCATAIGARWHRFLWNDPSNPSATNLQVKFTITQQSIPLADGTSIPPSSSSGPALDVSLWDCTTATPSPLYGPSNSVLWTGSPAQVCISVFSHDWVRYDLTIGACDTGYNACTSDADCAPAGTCNSGCCG